MNPGTISRGLLWSAVAATVLTALCPLYFAVFWMRLYAQHGQPIGSVLSIGSGGLRDCALYLAGAVAYVVAPRLRPVLRVLAVVIAVAAVAQAPRYWSFVQQRNMFHNLLAEPIWEMYGRVAMALLCVAHFVVERTEAGKYRAIR